MIYAIAVVLVLICDQALKYWTVTTIPLNTGSVPIIDGIIHFAYVRNYGAAFNILQNTRWFLVALTVIFVIAMIVILSKDIIKTSFGRWSAVMLLAGALGNGIDRLVMGYVVDMIEFEFKFPIIDKFPVFNIADIFVTVFGILFCIYIVFHKSEEDDAIPVSAGNSPKFGIFGAREDEADSHGGDIEMLRKAEVYERQPVRETPRVEPAPTQEMPVYEPPKPAPEAKPYAYDPANPFGEWSHSESLATPRSEMQASYIAQPSYSAPKEPVRVAASEAAYAEPARPAAPKPAAKGDMEFDLEDILAEFRD